MSINSGASKSLEIERDRSSDKASKKKSVLLKRDSIVKLNIGGYKFVTTKSTLNSAGESFFTSLLNGNMPSTVDEDGCYFIDRDGKYFEPILEYLRTGEMNIPPAMRKEIIQREADFYSIRLPSQKTTDLVYDETLLLNGIFISNKYSVNEIVIFGPKNKGSVIRSAWSKGDFSYRMRGSMIEIEWESQQNTKNIWFFQNQSLVASSINEYDFFKQSVVPVPGTVYHNVTDPIKIFDEGRIYGFRFLTNEESKNDNALVIDIRNQWEMTSYEPAVFCHQIKSYHINFQSKESVRYKNYNYNYSNHETIFEECDENFTLEVLSFSEFLLARLISYKLVLKKDKTVLPIQHSRAFHQYVKKNVK